MTKGEIIILVFDFLLVLLLLILSVRSFREKGFLFNNAYLYASKKERETMDKKPYYRQTGIVFLISSLIFAVAGLTLLLGIDQIIYAEIPLVAGLFIYAIVSSVKIGKK